MNIHSALQHHRPPHDGALYMLLKLLPLRYPFTNRQKKILYHTLRNIEANALVTYRPPHDGALYMLLKLLPLRYPFTNRQKKILYHTLRNIEANALVTYSFPNLLPFVSCFCWFTLPDLALMLKAQLYHKSLMRLSPSLITLAVLLAAPQPCSSIPLRAPEISDDSRKPWRRGRHLGVYEAFTEDADLRSIVEVIKHEIDVLVCGQCRMYTKSTMHQTEISIEKEKRKQSGIPEHLAHMPIRTNKQKNK
jgi:hypothetical protein